MKTAIKPAIRTTDSSLYPNSEPACKSTPQFPLHKPQASAMSRRNRNPNHTHGSKYATEHTMPVPVCFTICFTATVAPPRARSPMLPKRDPAVTEGCAAARELPELAVREGTPAIV